MMLALEARLLTWPGWRGLTAVFTPRRRARWSRCAARDELPAHQELALRLGTVRFVAPRNLARFRARFDPGAGPPGSGPGPRRAAEGGGRRAPQATLQRACTPSTEHS